MAKSTKDTDKDNSENAQPTHDDLLRLIDKTMDGKAKENRRMVDELLEKIQDSNHQFFLEKMNEEQRQKEAAYKQGDYRKANHHEALAEVYRSIIERCFTR